MSFTGGITGGDGGDGGVRGSRSPNGVPDKGINIFMKFYLYIEKQKNYF